MLSTVCLLAVSLGLQAPLPTPPIETDRVVEWTQQLLPLGTPAEGVALPGEADGGSVGHDQPGPGPLGNKSDPPVAPTRSWYLDVAAAKLIAQPHQISPARAPPSD